MNTHKEKCEELRKLRVKIAKDLGKPELVRDEPCNFEGDCKGTCPACYKEEEALMKELYAKYESGHSIITKTDDTEIDYISEGYFGEAEVFKGDIEDLSEYESEDNELPIFEEYNPFGEKPMTRLPGKVDQFRYTKPKPLTPSEYPKPIAPMSGMVMPPLTPPTELIDDKDKEKKKEKKGIFGKKPNKK